MSWCDWKHILNIFDKLRLEKRFLLPEPAPGKVTNVGVLWVYFFGPNSHCEQGKQGCSAADSLIRNSLPAFPEKFFLKPFGCGVERCHVLRNQLAAEANAGDCHGQSSHWPAVRADDAHPYAGDPLFGLF